MFSTTAVILALSSLPAMILSSAIPRQLAALDPSSIPFIMVSNTTNHTEHAVLVPVDNAWHCLSSFICYDLTPGSAHPYNLAFPMQGPDSPCAADNVTAVHNNGTAATDTGTVVAVNVNCTVHAPESRNQTYLQLGSPEMSKANSTGNYTVPVPVARVCCGVCDTTSKNATEMLPNGTVTACA